MRKRRGKQRLKFERVPLHEPRTLNEVWSMDFVSDSVATGRRIKCLTVTDDFSHECLNEHWFQTLAQARREIALWQANYNEVRPHSSLARMPPFPNIYF